MFYFQYYVSNGYCGCEETDVIALADFDDIYQFIKEASDDNAASYEYVETGYDGDFETEEDRENYYQTALSYAEWKEISEEEYNDFIGKNYY